MKYVIHAYKHADAILASKFTTQFDEIKGVIESVTDEELIQRHAANKNGGNGASLAPTINAIFKDKFVDRGWAAESSIFQGEEYGEDSSDNVWRLDFAKEAVSIEVAFNHGEAIAWNLLKPTLASEVNNVKKAINTEVGVVITATRALKIAGSFDRAVGEYEKVLRYLVPLSTLLSVPMLIIGLEPPESFKLKSKYVDRENWGSVVML
jgi:hypothetical protein